MSPSQSFRDLRVWQLALQLVPEVYGLTRAFPRSEMFGLTSQIQRAAVSIPANIAEGQGRHGRREFRRFVEIALGSVAELETLLEVARRLGYVDADEVTRLLAAIADVHRGLHGLRRSLADPPARPQPPRANAAAASD